MPTLTIWCSYPNDDEKTHISYGFETLEEAEAAREAVLELVQRGGEFHLAGDHLGPMPFHADTVSEVVVWE